MKYSTRKQHAIHEKHFIEQIEIQILVMPSTVFLKTKWIWTIGNCQYDGNRKKKSQGQKSYFKIYIIYVCTNPPSAWEHFTGWSLATVKKKQTKFSQKKSPKIKMQK